jgi:hypothetical protein
MLKTVVPTVAAAALDGGLSAASSATDDSAT